MTDEVCTCESRDSLECDVMTGPGGVKYLRDPECLQHGDQHEGPLILNGPHEGEWMTYTGAAAIPLSLLLEGVGVPEGRVARYRYVPTRDGYVFKGFETLIPR